MNESYSAREACGIIPSRSVKSTQPVFLWHIWQVSNDSWKMPDEELRKLCQEHAKRLIPDAESRCDSCRVLRTPLAYPVSLNECEPPRKAFEKSTGIERLYGVGRNSDFATS